MLVEKLSSDKTTGVDKETIKSIEKDTNTSSYVEGSEFESTEITDSQKLQDIADLESYILERKSLMETSQSAYKQHQLLADQIWEASPYLELNGVPLFNIPLERAIVQVFESEVGEKDIVYNIRPVGTSTDIDRIEPNRVVMDHFYNEDRTSKKGVDFRRNFAKYGLAVIFEGVTTRTKKIRGKQKLDYKVGTSVLTGSSGESITLTEQLIGSRVLNPKSFLIDDGVNDYEDAIDCIELEYLSEREVISRFNGKQYFQLEKAISSLLEKNNEIVHYWNEREDIYAILINSILVYEGPNPYPHKELPYAVAVMYPSQNSPYGEGGFIKLLQFATPYLSKLMNITIKQAENSNMPPILMGQNVEFDGDEPIFDIGSIWHMSGPLSEVRELKVSPPDSSIFNVKEAIYDFIVQVTGLDLRQIYTNSNKTKFEAGLMEQSKNKRLSNYSRTLDYAYQRFLDLRLQNLHYYLDAITVTDLLDPGLKAPEFKKILLENTEINKLSSGKEVFTEVPGAYAEFEMNPESIRGNFRVSVMTESTKPLFPELKKDEIHKQLQEVVALKNAFPEQDLGIDGKKLVKRLFETYNVNLDEILPHTKSRMIEDANNAMLSKIEWVLGQLDQLDQGGQAPEGTPVTVTPGATA